MTGRVVIADAGPLIGLARIEALHLLRALFGRVSITPTVRDEILPLGSTVPFPDAALFEASLAEGWIDVIDPPLDGWKPLNAGVDAGEASAIHLACVWHDEGQAVLLVMDDGAGRLEAQRHGINLIGTAGVIGLARTVGLIPAARPLLERLVREGYYLGPAVIQAVLAETGE